MSVLPESFHTICATLWAYSSCWGLLCNLIKFYNKIEASAAVIVSKHIHVCSLHSGSEEGRHIWTLLLELLSLSPLSDAKWCFYEKIEFVKEWVVKSPKILFTLADIPHRSWCYVHWRQYIICICWLYYINGHCFKFATSHKKVSPSMPI